tara:strand:- start:5292 stop:5552 length:261 start_codon:yes stop_codon:yes gene_type:complete
MSEQPGINGLLATASVLVAVGSVTVLIGGVVVGGVVVAGVSLLVDVVDVVAVVATGSMEMASPEQPALNSTANRKQLLCIGSSSQE